MAKKTAEVKNEILDEREKHIEELSDALCQTRHSFSRRLHDVTIRQQQEQYISKVSHATRTGGCEIKPRTDRAAPQNFE